MALVHSPLAGVLSLGLDEEFPVLSASANATPPIQPSLFQPQFRFAAGARNVAPAALAVSPAAYAAEAAFYKPIGGVSSMPLLPLAWSNQNVANAYTTDDTPRQMPKSSTLRPFLLPRLPACVPVGPSTTYAGELACMPPPKIKGSVTLPPSFFASLVKHYTQPPSPIPSSASDFRKSRLSIPMSDVGSDSSSESELASPDIDGLSREAEETFAENAEGAELNSEFLKSLFDACVSASAAATDDAGRLIAYDAADCPVTKLAGPFKCRLDARRGKKPNPQAAALAADPSTDPNVEVDLMAAPDPAKFNFTKVAPAEVLERAISLPPSRACSCCELARMLRSPSCADSLGRPRARSRSPSASPDQSDPASSPELDAFPKSARKSAITGTVLPVSERTADSPVEPCTVFQLLPNKFPVASRHLLLVDATLSPQRLSPMSVDAMASLLTACNPFAAAFNSWGAAASIAHLHVHLTDETLPIDRFELRNKGTAENGAPTFELSGYPAHHLAFKWSDCVSRSALVAQLDGLHAAGTPYNVVLSPKVRHML